MAGNFLKYGASDAAFGSKTAGDLPVDAHELLALCAPRLTFVSYGGFAAGARATEQLRLVAIELRMAPVRDELNVKLAGYAADEQGRPADPAYAKKAKAAIDDLLWWARVLKEGRERHPR